MKAKVPTYVKIHGDSADLSETISKLVSNAVIKGAKDGIFVTQNVADIFTRHVASSPKEPISAEASS